jgi:hypothetical protein
MGRVDRPGTGQSMLHVGRRRICTPQPSRNLQHTYLHQNQHLARDPGFKALRISCRGLDGSLTTLTLGSSTPRGRRAGVWGVAVQRSALVSSEITRKISSCPPESQRAPIEREELQRLRARPAADRFAYLRLRPALALVSVTVSADNAGEGVGSDLGEGETPLEGTPVLRLVVLPVLHRARAAVL